MPERPDIQESVHPAPNGGVGMQPWARAHGSRAKPKPSPQRGRQQPSRSRRGIAKSFTNLLYHAVFATKDRRPIIEPEFRERLYKYIGGIIRAERGIQLDIGGAADHVHTLMKLRPDDRVADMLRLIKANSSRWLNEGLTRGFHWQDDYAAFTVSESQAPALRRYIAGHEEHHRKMSFRDEPIALLRKNRIKFDEGYI